MKAHAITDDIKFITDHFTAPSARITSHASAAVLEDALRRYCRMLGEDDSDIRGNSTGRGGRPTRRVTLIRRAFYLEAARRKHSASSVCVALGLSHAAFGKRNVRVKANDREIMAALMRVASASFDDGAKQ